MSARRQVETDKAVVDFEAQEEGFIAKILVDAGANVLLGTPIAVTVRVVRTCQPRDRRVASLAATSWGLVLTAC